MIFKAIDTVSGITYSTFDERWARFIDELQELVEADKLVCAMCRHPVRLLNLEGNIWAFTAKTNGPPCRCRLELGTMNHTEINKETMDELNEIDELERIEAEWLCPDDSDSEK